ncbi:MAG TPA: mechanosensitive ion channel family protein [Actinomycetota bacterium]|nr:mechanosensitive ion channel family protein [Actinomycetota bacterium]
MTDFLTDADFTRELLGTVASIAVIVVATLAVFRAVRGLLGKLERRLAVEDSQAGRNLLRSTTLVSVLRSLFSVVIWGVSAIMILDKIGLPVGPLLTGAGIAGVAIGFGAQSLVRDFVTGFFVLLEDQYRVGDSIEISIVDGVQVKGKVERFSLRSTALRESNGTLHHISNGVLQVVSNRSAGWSQAILDIGIRYEQNLAEVKEALREAGRQLMADPDIGPYLTQEPEFLGVEDLSESRVTVRVVARTQPGRQRIVERAFRQCIKETFEKHGIRSGG